MTQAALTTTTAQALRAQQHDTITAVEVWAAQLDCKDSSRRLYKRTIMQFFSWVEHSGRMLAGLTRADIIAYRDGLINGTAAADGQPKSTLTAASYLTSVKLFYKWLHAQQGIITNIADGVKMPKRVKRFEREPLTTAQVRQLLDEAATTASPRDKAILNLLLRTGMRTIEVVRADIKDMQIKGGQVVLYVQGKGHDSKDNFVTISDATRQAIAAYLETRPGAAPTEPLFACDSNRNKGGRLTTRVISGIARQHLDAIGLAHIVGERNSHYTAHSFRHTFACTRLEQTGDYSLVQADMRHANPATTQMYTYHIEEKRRLAAAAAHSIDNMY